MHCTNRLPGKGIYPWQWIPTCSNLVHELWPIDSTWMAFTASGFFAGVILFMILDHCEFRNRESVLLVLQSSMTTTPKTVAMRQIQVCQATLKFLPYNSDVISLAHNIYLADSHSNTMFNTNPSCFSDISNKVCKLRESFLKGLILIQQILILISSMFRRCLLPISQEGDEGSFHPLKRAVSIIPTWNP